jgi:hypothetical protein
MSKKLDLSKPLKGKFAWQIADKYSIGYNIVQKSYENKITGNIVVFGRKRTICGFIFKHPCGEVVMQSCLPLRIEILMRAMVLTELYIETDGKMGIEQ